MKRSIRLSTKYTKFLKKFSPYIRICIGIASFVILIILAAHSLKDTSLSKDAYANPKVLGVSTIKNDNIVFSSLNDVSIELTKPTKKEFKEAEGRYNDKLKRIEEEKRRIEEEKKRIHNQKVSILRSYLKNQASPMAEYADTLFDSCMQYSLHYCKYFISISAVETGFGKLHYGTYNAWGWGGRKFSGWGESIPYVSNAIAKYYYLQGYNTFERLAYDSAYGPHNKEKWVHDLYMYYNGIPDF